MARQTSYYSPWPQSMYLHDNSSAYPSAAPEAAAPVNPAVRQLGQNITQPPESGLITTGPALRRPASYRPEVNRTKNGTRLRTVESFPTITSSPRSSGEHKQDFHMMNGLQETDLLGARESQRALDTSNWHTQRPRSAEYEHHQNGTNGRLLRISATLDRPLRREQPDHNGGVVQIKKPRKPPPPLDLESLHVNCGKAGDDDGKMDEESERNAKLRPLCILLVVLLVILGLAAAGVAIYFGVRSQKENAPREIITPTPPTMYLKLKAFLVSLKMKREFPPQLLDNSTDPFREYQREFCKQMLAVFSASDEYQIKKCSVEEFRNGSVIVIGQLLFPEADILALEVSFQVYAKRLEEMLSANLSDPDGGLKAWIEAYNVDRESVRVADEDDGLLQTTTTTTAPTTTTPPTTTTQQTTTSTTTSTTTVPTTVTTTVPTTTIPTTTTVLTTTTLIPSTTTTTVSTTSTTTVPTSTTTLPTTSTSAATTVVVTTIPESSSVSITTSSETTASTTEMDLTTSLSADMTTLPTIHSSTVAVESTHSSTGADSTSVADTTATSSP